MLLRPTRSIRSGPLLSVTTIIVDPVRMGERGNSAWLRVTRKTSEAPGRLPVPVLFGLDEILDDG
jgi:hypothetical protein